MIRALLPAVLLLLSACGSKPPKATHVTHYRLNDEVMLSLTIESSGASGHERYLISYPDKGEEYRVFEGFDADEFDLDVKSDLVTVRFCNGKVDLARAIWINSDSESIPLQLITYCPGKGPAAGQGPSIARRP